jgi:hypothetical protein
LGYSQGANRGDNKETPTERRRRSQRDDGIGRQRVWRKPYVYALTNLTTEQGKVHTENTVRDLNDEDEV